jgi:hypothetical protein
MPIAVVRIAQKWEEVIIHIVSARHVARWVALITHTAFAQSAAKWVEQFASVRGRWPPLSSALSV